MVSISLVPKLEPAPVSYIQLEDGALRAEPLKSSLNCVVQPDGGAGTAAGVAIARAAAAGDAVVRTAAAAETAGACTADDPGVDWAAAGSAATVRAVAAPAATISAAIRTPLRRRRPPVRRNALRALRIISVTGPHLLC